MTKCAIPISLELSEQEHDNGNDSAKNNSTAQERFIHVTATQKDCDNFLLTNINKKTKNAADRRVCVS